MRKQEKALFEKVFLKHHTSGETMKVINIEGTECGHDHVRIICQGKTGAFLFKIYSEEL